MNRYSYQGNKKIKVLFLQAVGVFGYIITTIATIFTFAGIWVVPQQHNPVPIINDSRLTLICFAIWFLIVGWSISSVFVNFLPTIWIDDDEIRISAYLIFRIRIPWSGIVDIGAGNPPRGLLLVRARRISLFHRAYGWLYSRTLYPSFLIEKGITDRNNLIKEIIQRITTNS